MGLHTKVASLDTSAGSGSAVARIGLEAPARYAGVYYRFSDPTQTARITVQNQGNILFQQSGCNDSDALHPYDQTKWPFPVAGELIVVVDSYNEASAAATCDVSVLLDRGGAS